ncbi:hypothetical protein [Geminicoccus roseus]|uniref:hypothetical protein n=1 Tax=Geminicoccus roseus TaxID=404900 RepID=UPI0004186774|nr:hypothetical protein [Geminicoccus roseus]
MTVEPAQIAPKDPREPGHLDVEFAGRTVEQLQHWLGENIPADARLVAHGRSASLRVDVPRLVDHRPLEKQVLEARVVFAQVLRLLAFAAGLAAIRASRHAAR